MIADLRLTCSGYVFEVVGICDCVQVTPFMNTEVKQSNESNFEKQLHVLCCVAPNEFDL